MDTAPAPVGHSPLGMSVLERRYSCPGSMRMEAGEAEGAPSVYAKRGTELHAAAAECLTHGLDPLEFLPDDPDGAAIVADYVHAVRQAHAALGGQLLIEQGFHLRALHDLYWGTADAVIISPPSLAVFDLKTGAGHGVPVRRPDGRVNFQLGGYALGVLQSLPKGVRVTEVTLIVVQPRLGPPECTTVTVAEVQDLAADLIEIAEAALAPEAPLVAGEHCTFCRARGTCPELLEVALERAGMEFRVELDTPVLPVPAEMEPALLAGILDAAEFLEMWIHAVKSHAKALADRGVEILGHKLVDKRGRRVWVDEVAALKALDFLPVEDLYLIKAVSPPRADKAIKRLKLKRPKEWASLIRTSDPGTALVPLADPRPAVAPRAIEFDVVGSDE